MSTNKFLTIVVMLLQIGFYHTIHAQEIIGLWEIKAVQVGNEEMTPVAKWTRINADGSYTSGNGWLQNSEGTWNFESDQNTFLPIETNGIKDSSGPFTVSFKANDTMLWQRMEDGDKVEVVLGRIEKLPKSTADQLTGLWDLMDVKKDEASIMHTIDTLTNHYRFIRWDRVYMEQTSEGERSSGYWHIHGHKPEITLISHDAAKPEQAWHVAFDGNNNLELTGLSDSNKDLTFHYKRIFQFPE